MKKLAFYVLKKTSQVLYGSNLDKITVLKALYDFFLTYLKPPKIVVFGMEMWLDKRDSLRLSVNGVWEKFQTKLFRENIKKGMTVVDVGAHIGYYTLLAAKLVGSKGKVFAFEPNKDRFQLLLKNVKINGFKNIVCINKAVVDKSGQMELLILYDNTKDITQTVSLDDFFKNRSEEIDLIKIDTDGADVLVVKGAQNLVRKNHHIAILTELWPAGLKRFGSSLGSYLKLLNSLGFKLFQINEADQTMEKIVNINKVKVKSFKRRRYTNLLCTKKLAGF